MASLTAIEFGADTCALARTAVRQGEVRLFAVEALDPAAFPGDESFTVAVRKARKALKLPRRARVVLWGLPEGADRRDVAVKQLLLPLTRAGFRVESVVSPSDALAALARVRPPRGEGATCWLAINRRGVAIIVVRPGKRLYEHSFVWDSNVGSMGSQARLLQRYSLVSYLSPQIKRAMAEARKLGTPVSAIVTCGNLPDLRSLTMPLIEELDVEVETLDSLDGLVVKAPESDKLTESAPAIRLACAGAIARETRPWNESTRRSAHRNAALLRVAAVIAIIAAAGYAWYWLRDARPGIDSQSSASSRTATNPPAAVPPSRSSPASQPATPPVQSPPKAAAVPAPIPQPPPRSAIDPAPSVPVTQGPARVPAAPQPAPPVNPPSPRADNPGAGTGPAGSSPAGTMPALLKDAVPRVTAILVANDRRFATIDSGQVVGVGDVIGRRIVVGIEEKAVVLREPSGVILRVGLGGRVLGIERGR